MSRYYININGHDYIVKQHKRDLKWIYTCKGHRVVLTPREEKRIFKVRSGSRWKPCRSRSKSGCRIHHTVDNYKSSSKYKKLPKPYIIASPHHTGRFHVNIKGKRYRATMDSRHGNWGFTRNGKRFSVDTQKIIPDPPIRFSFKSKSKSKSKHRLNSEHRRIREKSATRASSGMRRKSLINKIRSRSKR